MVCNLSTLLLRLTRTIVAMRVLMATTPITTARRHRALRAAATLLGVTDLQPGGGEPFDAVGHSSAGSTAFQVKVLSTLKHEDLEGRLAHAVLAAQRRPELCHVVVVQVPKVTAAAVNTAREFFVAYGPTVQWMLLGDAGEKHVHAPALGVQEREFRSLPRKKDQEPTTRGQLFTDLNAWMLKILLLREAPANLWPGPRTHVGTASELARVAHVSTPHAHRFVRICEDMDFLRRSDEGFRIVRTSALMDLWFDAQRLASRKVVPVRWIMGRPSTMREVFAGPPATKREKSGNQGGGGIVGKSMSGDDQPSAEIFSGGLFGDEEEEDRLQVAVAGFDACAAMKILHTNAVRHEVHVAGDLSRICERFDLEPCEQRDAHFFLLPAQGVAVFRGCIEIDGLRHVDVLQAALDVIVHAARGREQAEFITADVLGLGSR